MTHHIVEIDNQSRGRMEGFLKATFSHELVDQGLAFTLLGESKPLLVQHLINCRLLIATNGGYALHPHFRQAWVQANFAGMMASEQCPITLAAETILDMFEVLSGITFRDILVTPEAARTLLVHIHDELLQLTHGFIATNDQEQLIFETLAAWASAIDKWLNPQEPRGWFTEDKRCWPDSLEHHERDGGAV